MASSLALFDYVVFGCMLAVSAGIGIYYRFSGGRQKTNKEYFLADKNMPVIPVAFSLMASFMSAITLLGVASENYMYGTQFIVINISYIIGTPVAAYVFLPVFFQMQATSSFEYLEKRFCREVRLFASAIFIMQMMLYMSIVLYAPALTLSAVTGLSRWTSVISVGIVCTFYCTIGGIKAVLWTDLFQSILMFSAVFSVIIKGVYDVGGFSNVWDLALKGDRIEFLNIDLDPTARHTVWNLIIGGFFTYTSIYAVNQAQIQRLLTVKNLKKSQMALFLNWPITTLISLTTAFSGLVVYANLAHCDPLLREEETNVKSSDQILPYFVMNSLNVFPGLPGVFVAGIFSGSLSTMSSAINSLTAVTVEDFLRPSLFKSISENRIAYFTKLTAFMFGLLCIFLTYVVEKLGGILQASLTVFNVVGGPMLGLYSLGMLCRRANAKGSMVGYLIALAVCFWIGFGSMAKSKRIPSSHRYVDGCISASNSTFSIENFTNTSMHMHKLENFMDNSTDLPSLISSEDLLNRNDEYIFPLYKISYMWYAAIGWLICVIVGFFTSLFFEKPNVHPILLSPVLTGWHSNKNPVTNTGGGSADNHLIQFMAEIPELFKTGFAYRNAIGLPSHILVKNT